MQQHLNLVQGISKEQLEDITTSGDEGAFALDNSGKLLHINKQAERLLGWTTQELQFKSFFASVNLKLDTLATIGATSCAALRSVGCSHLQKGATIVSKDGRSLDIIFITIPIFEQGRMVGKVYVFSENTSKADPSGVYEQVVNYCAGILLKLDLEGSIVFANEYAQRRFGDKINSIVPADIIIALQKKPEQLLISSTSVNRCKDILGEMLYVAWSVNAIRDNKGKVIGSICIGNDISEIDAQGETLMPDKGLAQSVCQSMHEAVLSVDLDGLVAYLNPQAERLTGWSNDDARGLMLNDVLVIVDSDCRQLQVSVLGQQTGSTEIISGILSRRDGRDSLVEARISSVIDVHGKLTGSVIVFKNITESNSDKHWSLFNSKHDALTGLLARPEFESKLTVALSCARNNGGQHALCSVDISSSNEQRELNSDQIDDDILKQFTMLISQRISPHDIVARIGATEFGILLNNCSLQTAQDTALDICRRVEEFEFITNGTAINLVVSIGLIPITSRSGGLSDVLRIVDTACFVAKGKGRNGIHVYNLQETSAQDRQDELLWIHKIRHSLCQDQFRLFMQVIAPLNCKHENKPHYEVLLRMRDNTDDLIRPGAFLPTAVRFDLMPAIDRWVIKNTLSTLEQGMKKGRVLGIYSINLSAQSLNDDNFLSFVIDQLDKTTFPADNICFEITESSALSNLMIATRFMSIVRGMGCRFSLDDFGRGFSSYAYLKNLPLDYLKIDGSFIRELSNDPVNLAMVQSINQIGHIIGVQTIAECVERTDTYDKLVSIGVDHVQGYKTGRPVPLQQNFTVVKSLEPVD